MIDLLALNIPLNQSVQGCAHHPESPPGHGWRTSHQRNCLPSTTGKDNIVTRLNTRVRYHDLWLSFHLTSKFRWGQYFYVKVFQNFSLFRWRINVIWFGSGKLAYEYTNQSIQMGLFSWKVPIDPVIFFYLSIVVERFTMYNLVVLYLWASL